MNEHSVTLIPDVTEPHLNVYRPHQEQAEETPEEQRRRHTAYAQEEARKQSTNPSKEQ
jgi:hypothetical protein